MLYIIVMSMKELDRWVYQEMSVAIVWRVREHYLFMLLWFLKREGERDITARRSFFRSMLVNKFLDLVYRRHKELRF
jgi:hypothetical protein